MDLERCCSNIRTIIGYSDADIKVYIDVLGPLYVIPGPYSCSIHLFIVWDTQAEGMP